MKEQPFHFIPPSLNPSLTQSLANTHTEIEKMKAYRAHILVFPYPCQGHINPMLQLSKRLASKGLRATVAITNFISKTMEPKVDSINFDTISDGYDEGGFAKGSNVHDYLESLEVEGSRTLDELIKKQESLGHPIDCIIYDSILPWALDVAKKNEIVGATFFTQSCGVNYVYYHLKKGLIKLPLDSSKQVSIPGLPLMDAHDMPSFVDGSYPAYFELTLKQYSNVEQADFVLINSFYKLEEKVAEAMKKDISLLTVGPTVPSLYLDNRVANDNDYSLNLFHTDPSLTSNWLSTKPRGSVVYVAFGSMASLDEKQMEELAYGLINSNCHFLWVVRDSEDDKLPKDCNFMEEVSKKGLIVKWSSQLEILNNEAIGCFLSHCGWNSTIEALSLGVPLVAMPQWTDQTTNAKLVEDVWEMGIRVKVDGKGLVGREEIERCIKEVIEGEKGNEIKKNAIKWKELAKEAFSEGGSSDNNIEALVSKLTKAPRY